MTSKVLIMTQHEPKNNSKCNYTKNTSYIYIPLIKLLGSGK